MRLQVAQVKRVTGKTRHLHTAAGLVVQAADPSFVEIESDDGGFFLFRYLADGRCIADTWHSTIDEAKRQAAFEYEIGPEDWRPCLPDETFACPCCARRTFALRPPGTFAICPICNWEDDNVQFANPDYAGGANSLSLNQARAAHVKQTLANIADLERTFGPLPADYIAFLRDGGGGSYIDAASYVQFWYADAAIERNIGYRVRDEHPGLFLFGSDGGGEALGFDLRGGGTRVVVIPYIGLDWKDAIEVGKTFTHFVERMRGGAALFP